jgi:hypothetical protein
MRLPLLFGALGALALTLPAAHALARIGAAEVREGPCGAPCFTIGPREERAGTPDFHGVTVSDGQHMLWTMTMPPERTFPLGVSMCVPYGGQVASLPRSRAAALEPGKVYYLRIEARAGKRLSGCLAPE